MSHTGICFLFWKIRAEKIDMEATPAKVGLAKLVEQEFLTFRATGRMLRSITHLRAESSRACSFAHSPKIQPRCFYVSIHHVA
jgi:hypothetical protein